MDLLLSSLFQTKHKILDKFCSINCLRKWMEIRRNNGRLHPMSGGKVNIDFGCFLSCPSATVKPFKLISRLLLFFRFIIDFSYYSLCLVLFGWQCKHLHESELWIIIIQIIGKQTEKFLFEFNFKSLLLFIISFSQEQMRSGGLRVECQMRPTGGKGGRYDGDV